MNNDSDAFGWTGLGTARVALPANSVNRDGAMLHRSFIKRFLESVSRSISSLINYFCLRRERGFDNISFAKWHRLIASCKILDRLYVYELTLSVAELWKISML